MGDVSSTQSFEKDRKKDFLPSSTKDGYSYGSQQYKHQDISRLLHHNYLNKYVELAKDK
jgi:hypothetical protein